MDLGSMLEAFLQTSIDAILLGGIYALLCVGLALIFSIMYVVNFAQGEFMMLGMYVASFVAAALGGIAAGAGAGVLVLGALAGGGVMFIAGIAIYQLLLRNVTAQHSERLEASGHYVQLTITLGLSLVLSNGALIAFGSHPTILKTALSDTSWSISIGPLMLFVNQMRVLTFTIACVIGLLLTGLITRTRLGCDLRATADNAVAAQYVGINTGRCYLIAFGLGSAVTAIGGGLLAASNPFQPYVGLQYVVIMFTGVVLGGMRSVKGAWIGGMLVACIQQFAGLLFSVELQDAAIYIVFVIVLIFRPNGIFGKRIERV